MLWPVVLFVVVVLLASMSIKGPLWAMGVAWLISLVPISTGLVVFATIADPAYSYSLTLIAFIASYVAGAAAFHLMPRKPGQGPADPGRGLPPMVIVWTCWAVGLTGAGLLVVDFALLGGQGLSDLAALRDVIVEKTSASIYAQIGSVMTWACMYSYIFALVYRERLRPVRTLILVVPIAGYFLISLLSAGRQAAFQVMLATVFTVAVTAGRRRNATGRQTAARAPGSRLLIAGVSLTMIAYMGYIAVARNDGGISDDKTDVLLTLFNLSLSPPIQAVGDAIGSSLRAVMVEAVTYFSSAIAIFQKYLELAPPTGFGASSFPFIMRQLQSLTGVSPVILEAQRVDSLNALGVVGNGWTTAFSSYLADFGPIGAVGFLASAGYYSSYAWHRALRSPQFEDIVLGVLALLFAVYMPLSPALSDTNLFLLWIFCLVSKAARPAGARNPVLGVVR